MNFICGDAELIWHLLPYYSYYNWHFSNVGTLASITNGQYDDMKTVILSLAY